MKYRSLLLVIFVMLNMGLMLNAQQLPSFSGNEIQESITNPAKIHSSHYKYDHNVNAGVMYRYQWVGLDDAPRTLIGNFDFFNEDLKMNFGGSIINDQTGPLSYTGLYIKGAYQIKLTDILELGVGLSGGLLQYRVKGTDLNFLEAGDIGQENLTKFFPDFSLGAMLYIDKKYYFGISIPQTFNLNLLYRTDNNDFNITRVPHYYGIAGAHYPIDRDNWLELAVWGKYVENTPFHIGGNFRYEFKEKFWVGIGGASSGEFSAEAGVILNLGGGDNLLRFGYVYSNFFNSYGPNFGSAHELRATYSFSTW